MTLYYNNAEADGDLGNILNWWTDADFTIAGTIPTTGDTADISVEASSNTDGACAPDVAILNGGEFSAAMTAGSATVSSASLMSGTINGDVTFNSSPNAGTVNGSATFNGAYTDVAFFGTVSGTILLGSTFALTLGTGADFSATDTTAWTIDPAAQWTFNNNSSVSASTITGGIFVFNGTVAVVASTLTSASAVTFNASAFADSDSTINANCLYNTTTNNSADINGNSTHLNNSGNDGGAISGDVTMVGGSNNAAIGGDLTITGASTTFNQGGTVTGRLTVPGIQSGGILVVSLTPAQFGTYGTLAISGAAAGGRIQRLPQGFSF